MTALQDALRHSNNSASELVRWLHGALQASTPLNGVKHSGNFNICDFRSGLEEKDPSLSCDTKPDGAVFNRFGGDGFAGGAVQFVMSCLNVSQAEAAKMLIDRAGLIDTPRSSGEGWKPNFSSKQKAGFDKIEEKLAKLKPMPVKDLVNALNGWAKIEAGEDTPQGREITRRGLNSALLSGSLVAYRWTGENKGRKFKHIGDHALLFEVRGIDGKAWALKARNTGTGEELTAEGKQRYCYAVTGYSTPAWCSLGHTRTAHIVTEGELNGAAIFEALEASDSLKGRFNVQGVASAEAVPHMAHIKAGEAVYLFADEDDAGKKARQLWANAFKARGASVYHLPPALFGKGLRDACDVLGSEGARALAGLLKAGISEARPHSERKNEEKPVSENGDVWISKKHGYGVRNGAIVEIIEKTDPNGDKYQIEEKLCNFTAFISADLNLDEGEGNTERQLEIVGANSQGKEYQPVRMPASEFVAMNWPISRLSAGAIVRAGQGKKDKLREAIQELSEARGRADRTIYKHTGWIKHGNQNVYLTAGACIGEAGAVEGLEVDLKVDGGADLSAFALPDPAQATQEQVRKAVQESLTLLDLVPASIAAPILGAVYRAPLGKLDALVFPVGKTGLGKTVFVTLAQQHYGALWGSRGLPAGWNTTANTLERLSFVAKDVVLVVDDFKPKGTRSQIETMHAQMSRILSGVGDGSGRGRMRADGKLNKVYKPRGVILSSGEETPRGHSDLARAVIIEVTSSLFATQEKSDAFKAAGEKGKAGIYALAMASYVQHLAGVLDEMKVGSQIHEDRVHSLLNEFKGDHKRTASNAAELFYGWEAFLSFAVHVRAISQDEAGKIWETARDALVSNATDQGEFLQEVDPTERALSILSGLLSSGQYYLEEAKTGLTPPDDVATKCGYRRVEDQNGLEYFITRPTSKLLGWYEKTGGDEWAYFKPETLHTALQAAANAQGLPLNDKTKLFANMRDTLRPRGLMRCEDRGGKDKGKFKTTTRVTIHSFDSEPQVIALRFPLDQLNAVGRMGRVGRDSEKEASSTAFSILPIYINFKREVGRVGRVEEAEGAEEWIA